MSKTIANAVLLAYQSHDGQCRKYSGTPYILHPIRVAAAFAMHPLAEENSLAAAYCHDLIEDTPQNYSAIEIVLGKRVADIVQQLTNPSKGSKLPRAERKNMDRAHLRGVERVSKVIKMFDRIDNLNEMVNAPTDFKMIYAEESLSLLEAIGDADKELAQKLRSSVVHLISTIKEK